MRPQCTSVIKLSLMQFSRGRRGLLQDRLKDVSVKLYISARLVFCCRERLYNLGNKSWRVVAEPSQESVQNRMFLPSPTLNSTFACKRLAMFCVEKIDERENHLAGKLESHRHIANELCNVLKQSVSLWNNLKPMPYWIKLSIPELRCQIGKEREGPLAWDPSPH